MLVALVILSFVGALIPALLFSANLRLYRPPSAGEESTQTVSVLIPARNEAGNIEAALRSVLANTGMELEVVVLDDDSSDGTAELVEECARRDARVRLERAAPLPEGWNGKQHACFQLASYARQPLLLFMDADVRLAPDALRRLVPRLAGIDLLSGVPRQITRSLSERLLIPLIHFVLLGYLPLARMRGSLDPALGAGCGQLFLTTAAAYKRSGGHAGIYSSLHDGLHLPRLYRKVGLRTDLADLTPLAECRMYEGNAATWRGLAKNAHQGMGAPRVIGPMTLLLLLGQVAPWLLLAVCLSRASWALAVLSSVAALLGWLVRFVSAVRFRQSCLGAFLHPVGVLCLLAIQWWALLRHLAGRPSFWKGRACA